MSAKDVSAFADEFSLTDQGHDFQIFGAGRFVKLPPLSGDDNENVLTFEITDHTLNRPHTDTNHTLIVTIPWQWPHTDTDQDCYIKHHEYFAEDHRDAGVAKEEEKEEEEEKKEPAPKKQKLYTGSVGCGEEPRTVRPTEHAESCSTWTLFSLLMWCSLLFCLSYVGLQNETRMYTTYRNRVNLHISQWMKRFIESYINCALGWK